MESGAKMVRRILLVGSVALLSSVGMQGANIMADNCGSAASANPRNSTDTPHAALGDLYTMPSTGLHDRQSEGSKFRVCAWLDGTNTSTIEHQAMFAGSPRFINILHIRRPELPEPPQRTSLAIAQERKISS